MGGGAENEGHFDTINTTPKMKTTNNITNNNTVFHHHHGSFNLDRPFSSNSCSSMALDSSCGSFNQSVFGPPPSQMEVGKAIYDLQRLMEGVSVLDIECKGLKQMLYHHDRIKLQSSGYRRIHNAYRMLQTEPPFQKMVISIASDKTVWEAIVTNKAVQDLHGSSLQTVGEERPRSSYEDIDFSSLLLKWILDIMTKTKVVELMGKLGLLLTEILKSADQEEKSTSELNNLLEEKLRSSLLLSVVILLIVVFARSREEA